MDPKVNGQVQKDWAWLIAAYLFLGGVGAGAYVIGALNAFLFGSGDNISTMIGLWVSWPAVLIGTRSLRTTFKVPATPLLECSRTAPVTARERARSL